jgi:hypothetical protein
MPSATHIDRDDFDADHYADFMRDIHRSRITVDQLDIANRQLRKKEKLLSRIHQLKMKEHTRVKNDFIRKVEQDSRISNLPIVKETLKNQRRKPVQSKSLPSSSKQSAEITKLAKHEENLHQLDNPSKSMTRSKLNLDKFNHTIPLLN